MTFYAKFTSLTAPYSSAVKLIQMCRKHIARCPDPDAATHLGNICMKGSDTSSRWNIGVRHCAQDALVNVPSMYKKFTDVADKDIISHPVAKVSLRLLHCSPQQHEFHLKSLYCEWPNDGAPVVFFCHLCCRAVQRNKSHTHYSYRWLWLHVALSKSGLNHCARDILLMKPNVP